MTKRRWRLLGALAVLTVLGTLAVPAVHWRLYGWLRGEPFYHGRPTSYYSSCIRGYYAAPAEERPLSPTGQWALQHLPNRIFDVVWNRSPPFVSVRWIPAGKGAARHIHHLPMEQDSLPLLLAPVSNDDPRVQVWAAAYLLDWDADDVKPAVPALMRMLDAADPNVRYTAAQALGVVGSEGRPAVPRLRQLLTDTTRTRNGAPVAYAATHALLGIDPDSVPPAMRPEQ